MLGAENDGTKEQQPQQLQPLVVLVLLELEDANLPMAMQLLVNPSVSGPGSLPPKRLVPRLATAPPGARETDQRPRPQWAGARGQRPFSLGASGLDEALAALATVPAAAVIAAAAAVVVVGGNSTAGRPFAY